MTRSRPPGLALVGAAALAVGSLSPWATFAGFPGKMSLGGFAGGARLFCLLLAAGGLLFVVDVGGRRRLFRLGRVAVVGRRRRPGGGRVAAPGGPPGS